MAKVYILHENDAWVEPLRESIQTLSTPFEEWFLDEGVVPFDEEPPEGVFYNRMSASSHTRGHRYGPELTHGVLNWLESHDRFVANGSRALYLEVSKLAQYAALKRTRIRTPRTVAGVGPDAVLKAAKSFGTTPFILKPNRGGKGLGVTLIQSIEKLEGLLEDEDIPEPLDGTWLIQEYVRPKNGRIVRCEFVGQQFLYAVEVDAQDGFELCPADECETNGQPVQNRFRITNRFDEHPILDDFETFLRQNDVHIAGIEFVEDESGRLYTYDVNTNTNYNGEAERAADVPLTGMDAIARYLTRQLEHRVTRQRTDLRAPAAEAFRAPAVSHASSP